MKTARFFAMTILAAASIPLAAQQASATGNEQSSAHVADTQVNNSAQANGSANANPGGIHATGSAQDATNASSAERPMGFGDEASSHAYEMTSVTGELEGKLDAKHARVGDRVVLKTTEKVHTADGTVIPRGTRLVGHVTQVQAHDSAHADSQMGIAFDRAELKNGQSIAIHTLIRGVNPSPGAMAMNSMNNDDPMSGMGEPMGGATAGGGRGMHSGGGESPILGGAVQRISSTTNSVNERIDAAGNENTSGVVGLAGHGDLNGNIGAHQLAAARAVPHATAIPGVMLSGNSSASGVFSASKKNVEFESGTQMQLGIVADR